MEIFIIHQDIHQELYYDLIVLSNGICSNLDTAKKTLLDFGHKINDFHHIERYKITVYKLNEGQYEKTNKFFRLQKNVFTEHS